MFTWLKACLEASPITLVCAMKIGHAGGLYSCCPNAIAAHRRKLRLALLEWCRMTVIWGHVEGDYGSVRDRRLLLRRTQ
ncbi:hypothetical protein VNO78_34398 [Psophocarpus tetragonolobus]|uniref:Uncharacterized protein n=1 Tax=Psophocarpus tetragonolobus TaxID=3891 RepID=A0AAN9NUQ7_PSOTE